MIVLLDTSTPVCKLTFVDGERRTVHEWQADRQLAKGLLDWLQKKLDEEKKEWNNVSGIGVYQGPGSFTGLRIGLTVMNTFADGLSIPIVGTTGDTWQDSAIGRLQSGENDRVVLPYYGNDAHITTPRK